MTSWETLLRCRELLTGQAQSYYDWDWDYAFYANAYEKLFEALCTLLLPKKKDKFHMYLEIEKGKPPSLPAFFLDDRDWPVQCDEQALSEYYFFGGGNDLPSMADCLQSDDVFDIKFDELDLKHVSRAPNLPEEADIQYMRDIFSYFELPDKILKALLDEPSAIFTRMLSISGNDDYGRLMATVIRSNRLGKALGKQKESSLLWDMSLNLVPYADSFFSSADVIDGCYYAVFITGWFEAWSEDPSGFFSLRPDFVPRREMIRYLLKGGK